MISVTQKSRNKSKPPLGIYHTGDTVILQSDRTPSDVQAWQMTSHRVSAKLLRHFQKTTASYEISLDRVPTRPESRITRAILPPLATSKARDITTFYEFPLRLAQYALVGEEPVVRLKLDDLVKGLDMRKVKDSTEITVEIRYR